MCIAPCPGHLHDLCCKVSLILHLQTRPQRHPLLASTFHRSKGLAVILDEGGEQTFQSDQWLTQKLRRDIKGSAANEGGASLSPGFFDAFGHMRAISMFAKVLSRGCAINKS